MYVLQEILSNFQLFHLMSLLLISRENVFELVPTTESKNVELQVREVAADTPASRWNARPGKESEVYCQKAFFLCNACIALNVCYTLLSKFLHDSHSPIITVRTFVPRVCQNFAEFDIFLRS